ncbi:MAG TPA: HNH endonuclease [Polyangiaceae bacterium]|nr:HNH endonuclease [Polyangiaceae bacterium]
MRTPPAVRFYCKVDKNGPVPVHRPELGPCWVYLAYKDRLGYGRFWFKGTMALAQRVAWFLDHGEWPKADACHHCDNRACVRPSHLFDGTHAENIADRDAKGRGAVPRLRGSAHPSSKLTEDDVREIRRALAAGEVQTAIAARLRVSRSAINNVALGLHWAAERPTVGGAG